MIISHEHKFIFLKTRKTAGTSVELALRQLCGPDDIIAPIGNAEERRQQSLHYQGRPPIGACCNNRIFVAAIRALVIGARIGRSTASIALRAQSFRVDRGRI